MSAGHIRRRGEKTYELKYEASRDAQGARRIRYVSFKGTRRAAEVELAKLVAAESNGSAVDPSKETLGAFVVHWQRDWMAGHVSPKTGERYGELLGKHVVPRIGSVALQKLRPTDVAALYAALLRDGIGEGRGLSNRSVGHVHRVLRRVLGHAVQWGLVEQNVAAAVSPPKVESQEIDIIPGDKVSDILRRLHGQPIYPVASLALASGMRRGELLAVRWRDVDFDRGLIRVERSLETTRAGLRFKSPKTRHGRRTIALPATIVSDLRAQWRALQEQRLAHGLGKAPDEALIFSRWDGKPLDPDSVGRAWKRAMTSIGAPGITLHGLRHTHTSQLIANGLDVLTISRRLGHGSPAITLGVYGHLFSNTDDRAAEILEATFARARSTD